MRRIGLLVALAITACAGGGSGQLTYCDANGLCPSGLVCDVPHNTCVSPGLPGGGPGGTGGTGTCPATCPVDQYCDKYSSHCTTQPSCAATSDCPSGWECGYYQCVKTGAGSCTTSADCPAEKPLCNTSTHACQTTLACSYYTPCPGTWECAGGSCQKLAAGTCNRTIDCLGGEVCAGGRCSGCATTGALCTGALNVCDASTNACVPCRSSADCAAGLSCTPDGCAECGTGATACPASRPACAIDSSLTRTMNSGSCGECNGTTACPTGSYCYAGDVCRDGVNCTNDAQCAGISGKPHCDPFHDCVQCTADAHCAQGEVCRLGGCHRAPTGDVCADPMALGTLGTRTDLQVSLAGFGCEHVAYQWETCDPDVFYRFTLAAESRLDVAASQPGGTDPWVRRLDLALLSDGCGAQITSGTITQTTDVVTAYLAAGTYLLRLTGDPGARYAIALTATPVSLPAGNTCGANLDVLAPDATGHATRAATTTGLHAVAADACRPTLTPGPQAVYAIDLAAPRYVRATATPVDATFALNLEVKDACVDALPAGTGQTCNTTAGAAVTRTFQPLAAGRHYLVIDSEGGTTGAFRLDAYVSPQAWAANDACGTGVPDLAFPGGVATVTGSTGPEVAAPTGCYCGQSCTTNVATYCPSGGQVCGNDVYYRFSTVGQGDRKVVATVTGDGTWAPAVEILPACDAAWGTACATAAAGSSATTSKDILAEGVYLVKVASATAATGGPFTLSVTLSPPVYPVQTNETCSTATVVTTAPGAGVSVGGDTRGAADDASASCGGVGGKDVAYRVDLPAGQTRGRIDLYVWPYTSSALRPVLSARDGCPGSTELACAVSAAAGRSVQLPSLFVNGSVYAWVDGADGSAGPFGFSASFSAPPTNDTCSGAIPIPSYSPAGSVASAFPDATCAAAGGPDVFYALPIYGTGKHTVTVTLSPYGFTGGLAAFGSSCTGTCVAGAKGTAASAPVQLVVSNVSSGTLYVAVSTVDGDRGSFDLSYTQQ